MRTIISLSIALFISVCLNAQISENQKLQIDSLFINWDQEDTPGCAIAIYNQGKILYKKGYGTANLDYDIKITPKTVFDIGSVSKQFTAACIVLLENQGKLSLDDPIQKFIPEFPEYEQGSITIRHLLHHTSGLRDYLTLMSIAGLTFDDYFNEEMGLSSLINQKELNFKPGSEYLYSNSGYLLLAIIVRRISGVSIGEFALKNIFEQLNMNNTFVYEDGNRVVKNRAIGYARRDDKYIREHHFDFVVGGDGQVYTTVEDFLNWSKNLKTNTLGNDTFLDQMLTRGILNNGDTLDYALGLVHANYKGLETIGHSGAWGGFRANYLKFPAQDLSIAVMSNLSSFNPTLKTNQIADILLKNKFNIEPLTKESDEKEESKSIVTDIFSPDQLIGNYELRPSIELEFRHQDDTLMIIQSWSEKEVIVNRTEGNAYEPISNSDIKYIFSELKEGSTHILTIERQNSKSVWKRRRDIDASQINLKEYVGDYYSEELEVTYKLLFDGENLKVKVGSQKPQKMKVYNTDQFIFSWMLARFNRTNGNINGFELDAGRVNNLKFEKLN